MNIFDGHRKPTFGFIHVLKQALEFETMVVGHKPDPGSSNLRHLLVLDILKSPTRTNPLVGVERGVNHVV